MRGHGRSDMPEDLEAYESIRHAEDFRTVCEGFGLKKPFVLGWYVPNQNKSNGTDTRPLLPAQEPRWSVHPRDLTIVICFSSVECTNRLYNCRYR